jgi:hypothetical protein
MKQSEVEKRISELERRVKELEVQPRGVSLPLPSACLPTTIRFRLRRFRGRFGSAIRFPRLTQRQVFTTT